MVESTALPRVTLAIAGDVMLGRLVNDVLAERGARYVWGDVTPLLWDADAFLINLECAITTRVVPWHDGHYKPFHFGADPRAVEALRVARVDFASLANNHIEDFGPDGLLDTIASLDHAGIAHAGAGRDLGEAIAPALNFTTVSLEDGAFDRVAAAIDAARSIADVVIFSIHWGPNMRERPPEAFRHFAHRVIEAGATIFWGHSAHVVQAVELLPDRGVILYDTGDFVDDYAVDPDVRNDLGALFVVRLCGSMVERVALVPTHIRHKHVNRAAGGDREWFVHRMKKLCQELGGSVVEMPDGSLSVMRRPHLIAASTDAT